MNGQLLIVGIIVALAAIYLGRTAWRSWSASKAGCGDGCGGCGTSSASAKSGNHVTFIPVEGLTLRHRESEKA